MNDALRWLMRDEIEAGVQKGIREGIQEGMQKGMREGIQKGMQKGIEKGMEEGMLKKAREIAYELRDMGLSTDKIARAVKVSTETVQEWFAEQTAFVR